MYILYVTEFRDCFKRIIKEVYSVNSVLPLFNIFGLLNWAYAVIGNRVCFDFEDNNFCLL